MSGGSDGIDSPRPKELGRIKTGKLERRVSMLKAGLFASARFAGRSATNWFSTSVGKEERHRQILTEEAERFVGTLGELKGSVVKIGQMMALWGEHYLPVEITNALHQLEDQTCPLAWDIMQAALYESLPAAVIDELEINPSPIGAASLGQVHRAKIKATGEDVCLKIQYPHIANAIETDLDAVHTAMKLFRLIPNTTEFERWFDEIRRLLGQEVDYSIEASTTIRFATRLKHDPRIRVPKVLERYSSKAVLCLSYEAGVPIGAADVRRLSQDRRNMIAQTCLDVCWQEVFEWGEMQTDPNFGNYLVDLAETNQHVPGQDQIVLLDFGAVRAFEPEILRAGQEMVIGSVERQGDRIARALRQIEFYNSQTPAPVIKKFLDLCYLAIEPFRNPAQFRLETPHFYDDQGRYIWSQSRLATRALVAARQNVFSKYFSIPPKDFMYFSRKLIGVFTLMSVLDARLNGYEILQPHVNRTHQI